MLSKVDLKIGWLVKILITKKQTYKIKLIIAFSLSLSLSLSLIDRVQHYTEGAQFTCVTVCINGSTLLYIFNYSGSFKKVINVVSYRKDIYEIYISSLSPYTTTTGRAFSFSLLL